MEEKKVQKFNVRVYGLALSADKKVLLTDEYRLGMLMTKFPGGGLEPGEGTLDCLRRECCEELGTEIKIIRHYYTTDFFQISRLIDPPQQLISIYYLIDIVDHSAFKIATRRFEFIPVDGAQTFRWVPLQQLSIDELTFPIDKKVGAMLQKEFI
ncbi:MAG TPA: NUDIX domain-containing protein [Bacteroidales bacterium]|nr:NUDIX domain-containing protein [Bacteroidales bacterium]